MHKTRLLTTALTLAFLASGLTACGDKGDAGADKAKTQVVAKVNGDEISIHQLNLQMGRLGQLSEDQAKAASRQVLARLVDEQMILQQALKAKLDRDPKVLQALEAARSSVLTQAYMEQQMAAIKKPTDQEVGEFYGKHPELFEKRRIYRLQELAVAAGRDKLGEIESGIRAAKDFNGVAEWLKSRNLQFSASNNVRAAEQLPLDLLPRLQKMKDGELILIPTDRSINIVMLAASQEQPVDQAKARPLIEQYFVNQAKSELAKKTLEKLRAESKIEFIGAFSDMKVPSAGEKSAPAAESKSADKPAGEKPVADKPAAAGAEHIEKGVAGL